MISVYSGTTLGPFLGGLMADAVGFRISFFITGGLLFTGGLIILFFVKESFQRPAQGRNATLGDLLRLAISRGMLPLLICIGGAEILVL